MTNKEGNPLPLIIQKKDGGFNYATTDLAALRYRFNNEPYGDNATRIIYVTDHGQANHFAGVFQVAKKANWIPENCEVNHVPFGLVQGIDGKKLKTREGETIKLKDLLSESIKILNDREKEILYSRRLTDEPITLDDLSKKYKISRERIRQIENKAFEKLQKHMLNAARSKNLLPAN